MSSDLAVKVEVRSVELRNVDEWKGKHYGEQMAGMYTGGDFPVQIKVRVEKGHEYQPGMYVIDPRSYIADEMGNPKLKRVRLLPISGGSSLAQKKQGI